MSEVGWLGIAVLAVILLVLVDVLTDIRRGKGKYALKRNVNWMAPLACLVWGLSVLVLWVMALPQVLQTVNAFTVDAGYGKETLSYFVSHDLLPAMYVLTGVYLVARIIARPLVRPLIAYNEQERLYVYEENERAKARVSGFLKRIGVTK